MLSMVFCAVADKIHVAQNKLIRTFFIIFRKNFVSAKLRKIIEMCVLLKKIVGKIYKVISKNCLGEANSQ